MGTEFVADEPTTFERILEAKTPALDWALNKLIELDSYIRNDSLHHFGLSLNVVPTSKKVLSVHLNIFVTHPAMVKDKTALYQLIRILNIGQMKKTTTSRGFTKIVAVYRGVTISIFTHYCFEKGQVKVVKKGERSRAITRCVSKDEALKLAKENDYIIEE